MICVHTRQNLIKIARNCKFGNLITLLKIPSGTFLVHVSGVANNSRRVASKYYLNSAIIITHSKPADSARSYISSDEHSLEECLARARSRTHTLTRA